MRQHASFAITTAAVTAVSVAVSIAVVTVLVVVAVMIAAVVVAVLGARVASQVRRRRALAARKRRLARICASTDGNAAAPDAVFEALELGCEDMIGDLLERGADPAARHPETQQLAHTIVLARPDPDPAMLGVLFRAHCCVDAQIGLLLLTRPGTLAVVRQTLLALARGQWRSPRDSTVLHEVVDGCRLQCLDETIAVQLATDLLAENPQLLTVADRQQRTAATLAAECAR